MIPNVAPEGLVQPVKSNVMKDKEKLIVVFYIDVSKLDEVNSYEYMCEARKSLERYFDDTVKMVFMPSDENKVDCINPVLMNDEQYQKVTEKVKEFEDKFNEWVKEYGTE